MVTFVIGICLLGIVTSRAMADDPRSETFTDQEVTDMAAKKAIIHTDFGDIKLRFFPEVAPNHVNSFLSLSESGFYDTTTIHRIKPGFVIQGGDPNGDGTGGPGYSIAAEFNSRSHVRGILSMARSSDPDSAGSQFFICLADVTSLDGNYTVFGEVVKGMDVVDTMVAQSYLSGETPYSKPWLDIDVVTGGNYTYYVPYFIAGTSYYTGCGLKNTSTSESNQVTVTIYSQAGSQLDQVTKTLQPDGQETFSVGNSITEPGWIKVDADLKLTGFFGFGPRASGVDNYSADMSLSYDLSTTLHIPNGVFDETWDTTIYACNPNEEAAVVTVIYRNPSGEVVQQKDYTIAANGSTAIALSALLNSSYQSFGGVEMVSTEAIAAFALYQNIKSGGRSYLGLSAVDPGE